MTKNMTIFVNEQEVTITHPDKLLWPDVGVTKVDYIRYLLELAPQILPAMRGRLVMMWCYPQGVTGKGYARKSRPTFAPAWLPGIPHNDSTRMVVNDAPALAWAANFCALELHVEPDTLERSGHPTYLAFDLDPSIPDAFDDVLEVASGVRRVLDSLGLFSVPKTSGATGIHVFVPIEAVYSFQEARQINKFIAEYMLAQMPDKITLDRVVVRRGTKLYFDYLQLWQGKTMSAAYSTRATPTATVSTPLTWAEVERGFDPADFTIRTVPARVRRVGDLFQPVTSDRTGRHQSLDGILDFLKLHRRD